LDQRPAGSLLSGLFFVLAADWGIVALGSLLGAISAGRGARESLLTVVLFPLLTPLLLAAIRLTEGVLSGEPGDQGLWLGMALAFDAVFTAAALALFPSLYSGEE
jgi:heme exporter protein B